MSCPWTHPGGLLFLEEATRVLNLVLGPTRVVLGSTKLLVSRATFLILKILEYAH